MTKMLNDGTLVVDVDDATAVARVLVEDSKKNGDLYYADRPMGEWVTHDCLGMPSIDNDTCSVCGQRFYQMAETGCEWHFCPNCGADMKREDDE